MGAHPYCYFVKYQPDVDAALQALRQREFAAGRYSPVQRFMEFPSAADAPAPGVQHASIDEARAEAAEEGTRSILDIERIADEPDFCAAAPLPPESLIGFFGTEQPVRETVLERLDFMDTIERGHCVYMVIFKDREPSELFFAGYSFD